MLARATVLVVPRAGVDSTKVLDAAPEAAFLDMGVLEISGTEVRARVGSGGPFRFLVPESVHSYIRANGLYEKTD